MLRPWVLLGSLTAALVSGVADADAARRVALIIGNNNYEKLASLNNPAVDAERMASLLAGHGFQVMSCDGQQPGCFDLGRSDLEDALEEFEELSDGADVALLFYAGHGLQTADGNVLAPVDMEISCDTWKARREVLLDDVLEAMSGAKEKIVILDACRNDPLQAQQCLSRGARPLSFGTLALPDSVSRFLLITSTLNGQVALDGAPGEHSPFAEALFHWMEHEPQIQFHQLFSRVAKRVIERTTAANFTQVPEILIRGGAPDACVAANNCGADPEAELLRREIVELTESNRRNQELAEIGAAYLRAAGLESGMALTDEARQRILREIGDVSRALAKRQDVEGERALAALKEGNEQEAERLFEEVISASVREAEEAAAAAAARRAAANREAAEAARHIAALARPKDVAKAARYFQRAAEFDPGHYPTWMDLASVSIDIGNTSQALEAYRKASAIARDNGSLEDRYWAANGQGDVVVAQGRLDRALSFYEAARDLARQLVDQDPDNLDAQRLLSVSYNRVGDVLVSMGNLTGAEESYSAGFVIAERLAAHNSSNYSWQRDLAVSSERLGNVLKEKGDFAGALPHYQRSYDLMQPWSEANPDDYDILRFIMVSLNKIGDIRLAMVELEEALATYMQGMEIARQLVASDPNNVGWQRDLAISHERIGDVHYRRGAYDEALAEIRQSLEIARALSSADRDNLGMLRFRAISLHKIGDIQIAMGRNDDALATFLESLTIVEELVTADPRNHEWKSDLSVTLERIGDQYIAMSRRSEALAIYQRNLDLTRELAEANPYNAARQWGLFVSLWRIASHTDDQIGPLQEALVLLERMRSQGMLTNERLVWIDHTRLRLNQAIAANATSGEMPAGLGDYWQKDAEGAIYKAQGRLAEALEAYRAANAAAEQQAADNPGDIEAERNFAQSVARIGEVLFEMGDLKGARKAFVESVFQSESLVRRHPSDIRARRDLYLITENLAHVLQAQGDFGGALEQFETNLERARALSAFNPNDRDNLRLVMVALNKLGDIHQMRGAPEPAMEAFREGMTIAQRLVAWDPTNVTWQRDLAVSDERIGDVLARQGMIDESMQQYQAVYDRISGLWAEDRDNAELKRTVGITLNKLGDMQAQKEDHAAALESYQEGLRIIEELVAANPANLTWQADLTVLYERIPDTLVALGRNDEARGYYERNLELARGLAATDLTNVERQWGLYVALWRMADHTEEKIAYFEEALKLIETLDARGALAPGRSEWVQITRDRLEEARVAAQ